MAEDEPFTHELIRRALEPCGYTILSAKNAADAILTGEAHRGPIDLLLTDVVMPDLHGPELAQRIRRLRPEIKVLYVSGFIDHPAVDLATLGRDVAFLQKPFTSDALATKVREALDLTGGVAATPSTSPETTGADTARNSRVPDILRG